MRKRWRVVGYAILVSANPHRIVSVYVYALQGVVQQRVWILGIVNHVLNVAVADVGYEEALMLRGKPKVVTAVFLDVLDKDVAHALHAKVGEKLSGR